MGRICDSSVILKHKRSFRSVHGRVMLRKIIKIYRKIDIAKSLF